MKPTPIMDAAIESPMRPDALLDAVTCGRRLERERAELIEVLEEFEAVVSRTIDFTVEQDMQNLEFDVLDLRCRDLEIRLKARAALARMKEEK